MYGVPWHFCSESCARPLEVAAGCIDQFRVLLRANYGNTLKAWMKFDSDGSNRLDEEEFAVMLDRLHVYDTSTLDEVIADESTGEGLDANTGVTLFESVFGVSSMFGRDRSDTGGSDDSGQGNLAEHLLDPRAC